MNKNDYIERLNVSKINSMTIGLGIIIEFIKSNFCVKNMFEFNTC